MGPKIFTVMAPKKPKKTSYHHGDLRRALIDASLELIEEKGAQGLTLREVARRVGVSHAAPYRHFADKEALLAAAATEGFEALQEAMESGRDAHSDSVERFEAVGLAYVQFAVSHRSQFRVMFGAQLAGQTDYPELSEAGRRGFEVLVGMIVELQAAGTIAAGDPLPFALSAWSVVHGLATLLIDRRFPMDDGKTLEEQIGFVLALFQQGLFQNP